MIKLTQMVIVICSPKIYDFLVSYISKRSLIVIIRLMLSHFKIIFKEVIQWKPLNVITLGPRETDNINRMITVALSEPVAIKSLVF